MINPPSFIDFMRAYDAQFEQYFADPDHVKALQEMLLQEQIDAHVAERVRWKQEEEKRASRWRAEREAREAAPALPTPDQDVDAGENEGKEVSACESPTCRI